MFTPNGVEYKVLDHMDNEVIVLIIPKKHMEMNLQTDTMTLKQMLAYIKVVVPTREDALSILESIAHIIIQHIED
jgi:hypothetical protein